MKRLLLALLLVVSGCVQAPPPQTNRIPIGPESFLTLPAADSLGRSLEATQLVTARYGDRTIVFQTYLSATPERFLMVSVDPLGRQALSVTWAQQSITVEAADWLPRDIRPENILADLVLLYWPASVVSDSIAASGGTVQETAGTRTILAAGTPLAEIRYTDPATPFAGKAFFQHKVWGYSLDIQSQETTP
jgi:hypothetical protein